jgi:hypothetical protein
LRATLGAATLALAATLTGCASGGAPHVAPLASAPEAVAAPLIGVPPASVGAWHELGYFLAPWMAGDAPAPVSGPSAPTRVRRLRRDDGHWLAIVVVQVAPGSAPCPTLNSLHASDMEASSDGCLRMRSDADFDRWLQQQHSVLYHWLDGRGWTSRPRAWVSYRAAIGGSVIEAHALLHPALLEPATRNNIDFLAGGQPALRWAQNFAKATRAAGGGTLNVPPFPFAPPAVATPEAGAASLDDAAPKQPPATPNPAATAPTPAQAEQVLPPPAQTPRRYRP